VIRSAKVFVVVCTILLALMAAPALAQVFQSIALPAGDSLVVNCRTKLAVVSSNAQSETLHCALLGTP
jgi:hypothetical protein